MGTVLILWWRNVGARGAILTIYGHHMVMDAIWTVYGRYVSALWARYGCYKSNTRLPTIANWSDTNVLLHYGPHNSLETFIIAKLYRFIKQKRQTLNQTWTKMNTCKNSNDRQSFSLLDVLKSSQSNLHLETWRSILWSWQFQNAVEVINAASIPTTGFTFTRIINQIITFWKILQ